MDPKHSMVGAPTPKRRSIAGPTAAANLPAAGLQSFAITEKYVKGAEANKFDNMLKDAQVADSVKISGPVNITNIM